MELIDIGANLTHESFDHDRDAVLLRARTAGVTQMVITGASREHSPQALELAIAEWSDAAAHPAGEALDEGNGQLLDVATAFA